MTIWQIKDAKNRFSELLEDAQAKGPQIITRHGAKRAVVLSMSEYQILTAHRPDLRAYLLSGPKVDKFDAERDQDFGRMLEL